MRCLSQGEVRTTLSQKKRRRNNLCRSPQKKRRRQRQQQQRRRRRQQQDLQRFLLKQDLGDQVDLRSLLTNDWITTTAPRMSNCKRVSTRKGCTKISNMTHDDLNDYILSTIIQSRGCTRNHHIAIYDITFSKRCRGLSASSKRDHIHLLQMMNPRLSNRGDVQGIIISPTDFLTSYSTKKKA